MTWRWSRSSGRRYSAQTGMPETDQLTYASARGRWVLVATVLGSGLASLDASAVNIALPAIGRSFGGDVAQLQWIIDAYALTLSAFLLLAGALGDRYGRRHVFSLGVIWFAISSVACGLAPSGLFLTGGTCTAGRRGGVARSRQSSHSRGQLSRAGSLHGDRRLERARGSRAGYWTLRRRLPRSHRFLEMGVSRQTFRLRWPRSGSCSAMYRRRTIRLRHRISISVARCSRPSASAASRMPLSNRLRMGCTQSTSPERAPAA